MSIVSMLLLKPVFLIYLGWVVLKSAIFFWYVWDRYWSSVKICTICCFPVYFLLEEPSQGPISECFKTWRLLIRLEGPWDTMLHGLEGPWAILFLNGQVKHEVWGGGDSSVVRAPDSWLKGRGFESLLERRENFLLHGRLSVLTLISVSVQPPCYHSST